MPAQRGIAPVGSAPGASKITEPGQSTIRPDGSDLMAAKWFLGPRLIVSLLSHDMTLHPGDVICCGTSLGVGSMKEPSNTIEVSIEGIGTLSNTFVQ